MGLGTEIAGVRLKNPTVLAAGILGVTGASLVNVARNGAGAVTTKSIGLGKRDGHPNPVIVEFESGLMNAVGLSNPGVDEFLDEVRHAVKVAGVPVIASVFGRTAEEFGIVAGRISEAKPDLIELNISCPNVSDELGRPFGAEPGAAAKATESVKNSTKVPVIVKLTPNAADIAAVARAAEQAGADALSAINTLGPGMMIDIKAAKPVLANRRGGLSGPAIRPIAVRCVYDIYEAVGIPIVGMGGVTTGKDAVEMLMAGASAVGLGSAVHYRGIDVFRKVCDEIQEFMEQEGYPGIKSLIGRAHG